MKIAILLTAMFASGSTLASVGSSCNFVYEFAKQAMTARQLEMPITRLMKLANGDRVAEVLIMTAYKQPAFRVKDNQQKEIDRFSNQAYLTCLEAKGAKK